jgi:putative transposase
MSTRCGWLGRPGLKSGLSVGSLFETIGTRGEASVPYWRLFYHLVWATRERESLIGPAEEALIRRSFGLTMSDLDLIPHAVGIMPDHAHVVVSIPPNVTVSETIKRLKGASSKAVNARSTGEVVLTFSWQGGYGALSFGDAALERVIDYVEHQPEHHAGGKLWSKLERTDDDYTVSQQSTDDP